MRGDKDLCEYCGSEKNKGQVCCYYSPHNVQSLVEANDELNADLCKEALRVDSLTQELEGLKYDIDRLGETNAKYARKAEQAEADVERWKGHHKSSMGQTAERVAQIDVLEAEVERLKEDLRVLEASEKHLYRQATVNLGISEQAEQQRDDYKTALEIVKANSINPAHTMTMLGLEEVTDANYSIAEQALQQDKG